MRDLGELLEEMPARHGEAVFLSYMDGDRLVEVTYARFFDEVMHWADFLVGRGVSPGDRVGFITPKSPHQVRAFYACWWLGAIAVPVCEALGDLEMGFIIRDSEPKVILVDTSMREKVELNCGDIPVVLFDDIPMEGRPSHPVSRHPNEADAIAALIYTSGSTGMPKGVMLTHRNFSVNAECAVAAYEFGVGDRMVSLLPYWHSYALVCEVIVVPMGGAATVIPKDKRDFKRNIGKYRPTVMLVVPRIADAMKTGIEKQISEASDKVRGIFARATYNASRIFTAGPRIDGGLMRMFTHHLFYDPLVFRKIRQRFGGSLRFLVSGGAPLDLEHQIFFKYLGMPIYNGYGLTESSPVISSNLPERHKLGSTGPLMAWLMPENGGDWTFKDEKGNTGKDLRGELLVKGDCVMKGYWRHTDESAKTLADGWLHTGDMGYVDEDGFLFLEGRQGNMIVLEGGEKLHPEHVEDVIKNCELVTDCMVIGEGCKNVYVLVNVDGEVAAKVPEKELLPRLRKQVAERVSHLAAYQKPKDVLVLPEWTVEDGLLTVTLKVRRFRVWERHGDEIRAFLKASGEETVTKSELGIASSKIMESLGRG